MPVRFDASGDSLSRSAALPDPTAFTVLIRARIVNLRSADSTLIALESAFGSAGEYIYLNASNQLGIYCSNTGPSAFASTPATGVDFDVALRRNGSGVGGAWKLAGDSTWITVTGSGTSWTSATLTLGSDSASAWFDGVIAHAKVWDRVLTDDELLVEAFYRKVMYPTSINGHWPLDLSSDLADRSGNGRDLSAGGTLAESDALWLPWSAGHQVRRAASAGASIPPKIHHLKQQGFL